MIKFNDVEIKFDQFPNGETKMNIENIKPQADVINLMSFKYQNDSDLIKLMFVKKYLDELNLFIELVIYYMPYSRMDRSEPNQPFTLRYVTEFINNLNFYSIIVVEPHSDVTPALLKNVDVANMSASLVPGIMLEVNFNKEEDYLFFPDAGAQKRYAKHFKDSKSLVGYKSRDLETGRITDFKLVGEVPDKPFKAIIVDDMSSFGGTFLFSAEHLRKAGATEVYLVIAHAEVNILKGKVFESGLIDKVFTTNSIISESDLVNIKAQYRDKIQINEIEVDTNVD
jgi:ribose-phosphate pyrophosphokinase